MNTTTIRPGGPTHPQGRAIARLHSNASPTRRHSGMLSPAELRRAVAEMID